MKTTDGRDTEPLVMTLSTFLHAEKVKVKGQGHSEMGTLFCRRDSWAYDAVVSAERVTLTLTF